jgi:hypothetical protein
MESVEPTTNCHTFADAKIGEAYLKLTDARRMGDGDAITEAMGEVDGWLDYRNGHSPYDQIGGGQDSRLKGCKRS